MLKNQFFDIFLEFLQDLYDAEKQIIKAMPLMIQEAHAYELKKGLEHHMDETKEQVIRLEKIFKLLKEEPKTKLCKGMSGLIEEGKEILKKKELTKNIKDCFLIIAAQKIEHYEIASYGSLCTLVEHMKYACPDLADFDKIYNLLSQTLEEEAKADIKLTKIAEGKEYIKGVNYELEKEITACR